MIQIIVILLRALLASIMIAAGAAKLVDTQNFTLTLVGLGVPLHRRYFIRGLTFIIPLLELGLGIALVSGLWPIITDIALLILLAFFSVVVIVATRRTPNLTCRCFGALSDSQFSTRGLVRSLLLTCLALAVVLDESIYHQRFDGEPIAIMLLVFGYLIFAAAAAQATRTIADIKERAVS